MSGTCRVCGFKLEHWEEGCDRCGYRPWDDPEIWEEVEDLEIRELENWGNNEVYPIPKSLNS